LALLALFFIKSGYAALVTIEAVQMIYMLIFLQANPLPYLEFKFLEVLSYFHLTFLPKILPSLNLTTSTYSLISNDLSFMANSPLILIFIFIGAAYLLVSFLSSKKFINNKAIRKTFKKIRKHRMRYNIIHDAFWVCYLYAVFISTLQFKMGDFSSTNSIMNMILAIITFVVFLTFTGIMIYLGIKYRKTPEKVPKKYAFLILEPSSHSL